jgi:hypothetical protein
MKTQFTPAQSRHGAGTRHAARSGHRPYLRRRLGLMTLPLKTSRWPQATTWLLRAGATVQQINAVRKHLDAVK